MKVYIDGSYGTTGLALKDRLSQIAEYEIVELPYDDRKDLQARINAANTADIAVTCLPNEASKEIEPFIKVPLIDTSTEFRTNWTYGLAEIGLADEIQASDRIANPGCHATGFIVLVTPLRELGIIKEDTALSCNSITGYSGGGNKMIAEYTASDRADEYKFPRPYALDLNHKHLPEMVKWADLKHNPNFMPMVADNYSGMCVSVPVSLKGSKYSANDIVKEYKKFYKYSPLIFVRELNENSGFLNPFYKEGKDSLDIIVCGNDNEVILYALFDNLGKGASGSVIQCLNIKAGYEETLGLNI